MVNDNGGVVYWDGDKPLFGGGSWFIEDFAYYATSLTVVDRDFSGFMVSQHNATGHDIWGTVDPTEFKDCTDQRLFLPQGTNGYQGFYPQLYMPKPDGITDGTVTIQGARAYDPNLAAWTAPDAYQGDVHDPLSQRPYMWNQNNPFAYSDPSGYCIEDGCVGEAIAAEGVAEAGAEVAEALGDRALAASMRGAVARAHAAVGAALTQAAAKAANWAKGAEGEINGAVSRAASVLFRSGDQEVDGGTAGAIRSELATGQPIGGKFHLQKGAEELAKLRDLLQSNVLSKGERTAAEAMYRDLRQSFGGVNPRQFINNNRPPGN